MSIKNILKILKSKPKDAALNKQRIANPVQKILDEYESRLKRDTTIKKRLPDKDFVYNE